MFWNSMSTHQLTQFVMSEIYWTAHHTNVEEPQIFSLSLSLSLYIYIYYNNNNYFIIIIIYLFFFLRKSLF
jgi:hypothetical protein